MFVALRSVFKENLDLTFTIFVFIYSIQNLLVHLVDLALHSSFEEEATDDELFLRMFSFKLFQFVLCMLLSLIYSQAICPSIEIFTAYPRLLYTLFTLTIPVNILMLTTYLFELTFYDQHQRAVIFKSQLTRVFVTNISVYIFAIVYSHWIQSLVDYTWKYHTELVGYKLERDRLNEHAQSIRHEKGYSDAQVERFIDRKMDY
jgi:hypothetical protein